MIELIITMLLFAIFMFGIGAIAGMYQERINQNKSKECKGVVKK